MERVELGSFASWTTAIELKMKLYLPDNAPTIELPEPQPKKGKIEKIIQSHPWKLVFGTSGLITLASLVVAGFAVLTTIYFAKQSHAAEGSVSGKDVKKALSPVEVLNIVQSPPIALIDWLNERYPYGWVIFGLANGHLIHRDHFTKASISTDWESAILVDDRTNEVAQIVFPNLMVRFPGLNTTVSGGNVVESIPRKNNQTKLIESMTFNNVRLYFKVLYAEKGIFAVGLSDFDNPRL